MEIILYQIKKIELKQNQVMITEIRSLSDLMQFVRQLIDEGVNYHPDDNFENYVNVKTGEPTYTFDEIVLRNRLNKQCFDICELAGADIYSIAQEIFLKETGLDEFIPLPSSIA